MIISKNKKFIFVHIPKTAGTSIRNALNKYNSVTPFYLYAKQKKGTIYGHSRAKDIKKRIDRKLWNSSFKFAFVRNPWDWMFSYYFFLRTVPTEKIAIIQKAKQLSFKKYVNWFFHQVKPDTMKTRIRKGFSEFLYDNENRLLVNFVGKFENLNRDFSFVKEKIGVEVRLPKLNSTKHSNYRTYYDDSTKQLVEKMFVKDIELFKYGF